MTYQEIMTYATIAFTLLLTVIRGAAFKDGRVLKRYRAGSAMSIGKRQVQEDQLCICQTAEGLLAVLADGMGKNYGGKIAAGLAVDTIKQLFSEYRSFVNPIYFFDKAFHGANRAIVKELEGKQGAASVGAVVIRDSQLHYALAGNIKIAVFRNHSLLPVSTGHTIARLAEETYHQGSISREDALCLLENKRVYNYLGQDGFRDIEYFDTPVKLKSRDIVVLMSDGVYEGITLKEIEDCLRSKGRCQDKANEVMERINTAGNTDQDNASIILIEQP